MSAAVAGGVLLAAAVALSLTWSHLAAGTATPDVMAAQSAHLLAYLTLGGVLLLAAAAALRRRAAGVLVALQLVALLQLFPLVRTMPTAPLRRPAPWNERLGVAPLGEGKAVVLSQVLRPPLERLPHRDLPAGSIAANEVRNANDLYPAPGILYGLTYPLAPNIEGLASALHSYLTVEITRLPWPERRPWLRVIGADAAVLHDPPDAVGLPLLDTAVHQGAVTRLYAVDDPAPPAWWPRRVVHVEGPRAALARVAALDDPVATVVAAEAIEQDPEGRVRLISERPDRIEIEVASRHGGLAVVRRCYHPLFRARLADGDAGRTAKGRDRLGLVPTQLTLLGVVVPPGEHRVVIDVDPMPEILAALVSLATLLGVGLVAWRTRGSTRGLVRLKLVALDLVRRS